MQSATLDDFMALNEELAALVEAGVPLDLGLGTSEGGAARELERINATVARRVNRGESLSQALEGQEQDIPSSYRSLVQLGIQAGDLSAALDGSNRVAETFDDSNYAVESAFFYPLIVLCFAYAGLIGFCVFFVPTLESTYNSLRLAPGPGLRVLQIVRETLPYWIAIPPLLVLLFAWRFFRRPSRSASSGPNAGILTWLPGASHAVFQQRCATFAASLSELLDAGAPLDEGLRIAAGACGDPNLQASGQLLATSLEDGQFPADDSPVALRFPPFLRWSLWHSEPITGRGRALHMAADIYHESADRRTRRLQIVAPIAALVFLGGSITLLYGLALFVPLVELLCTLAK